MGSNYRVVLTPNMPPWIVLLLLCCITVSQADPTPVPECVFNISTLTRLTPTHYNGSWFVVARKAPSKDYLPDGINSSMIRLVVNGEQLDMTEYHSINGTCMPPLTGTWKRSEDGSWKMDVRTETGQLYTKFMRAIYHDYSGENNEEMNMVLWGCRESGSARCPLEETTISILSNSRHPQTLQLFKSAKHIEDYACVDILQLSTLDTYTDCGDDSVDEDQKLAHARIDENNEYVDVECRVENLPQLQTDITRFFDDPRVLTVVAYIDPSLADERIAHVSCVYRNSQQATCEWIREKTCFKTELSQSISGTSDLTIATTIPATNGSQLPIDWSGMSIWENGDEYISMKCLRVDDDGSCEQYRVYVWSDEDHMDQPTIREIYDRLQAACVDPTDLIFLNTFHECVPDSLQPSQSTVECGEQPGWTPVTSGILEGVWYIAADLNADPKIFLQSAVFELARNGNDTNEMSLKFYAQKDKACVGPGEGTVRILDNATLEVTVGYEYTLVPGYRSTMTWRTQVLYLDNQRTVLFRCFPDGAGGCQQRDLDVLVRSRHFSYNDLSLIQPYLKQACMEEENLRWFDLHSLCGYEMSASTKLRRDMVTLSHKEVLDILTNVQEPKCNVSDVRGVKADLHAISLGGTFFVSSLFDEMAMDTYAMVVRVSAVGNGTAVARIFQSAAIPGEPKECFTRVVSIQEVETEGDVAYQLTFPTISGNETAMLVRFLFFNKHVGVIYGCLSYNEEGRCNENAIYVLSRHESIDHAELTVLETVARSVCMDPKMLYHTAAHDVCVYDHLKLKPTPCTAVTSPDSVQWIQLDTQQISDRLPNTSLIAVASSRLFANPFALYWNRTQWIKYSEGVAGCAHSIVHPRFHPTAMLAKIGDDTVLLSPTGARCPLQLKAAQLSSDLPCLHPIEDRNSSCGRLAAPICQGGEPVRVAEQLLGEWVLHSSSPYIVSNQRCTVEERNDGQPGYALTCLTESWKGECEREERLLLCIDAWGGFTVTPTNAPRVNSPSELFPSGQLSATPTRLLLLDGDGKWSVWLRSDWGGDSSSLASSLSPHCVYPTGAHTRSMEANC